MENEIRQAAARIPPKAILCAVGARPNFMKIAPIMAALANGPQVVRTALVHTGQHYDAALNDAFFKQLGIPEPDINLGVGSGSQTWQTAAVMQRFEPVIDTCDPAAVLVVGDVNSTLACALVASRKGVPVIHVEAGLRSRDWSMPEEVNRVLTDQLAELLFITESTAQENLTREGIASERIHFVGNVMIDTLLKYRARAIPAETTLARVTGKEEAINELEGFALATLHRPSNVDTPSILSRLIETLQEISQRIPVVFPIHPRTRARLQENNLDNLMRNPRIICSSPLGYLETLGLMDKSRFVLTDSGGMQEETTALGIPCITLRKNTERPVTLDQGTNTLVGTEPQNILAAVDEVLTTGGKAGRIPEFWDGQAALRIRDILTSWLANQGYRHHDVAQRTG